MPNVYLLAADATVASHLSPLLHNLGAVGVNDSAWLVPWSNDAAILRDRIRRLLPPTHAQVALVEVAGEYEAV